jgi:hypothetical protein
MPDRARTDEYFARDAELRAALHEQFTAGEVEPAPPEVPEEPLPGAPAGAPAPGPAAPPAAAAAAAPRAPRRVKLARLARVLGSSRCVPRSGLRLRLLGKPRSAVASAGTRVLPFDRTVRIPRPRGRSFTVRLVVVDAQGVASEARQRFRSC